ncbi:MAG: sodium-independent anion transporter [Verrucomicrobia bacterium]|nr:sodium-independent anion transporter [Verrucomicrobiota bacterium]
MQTKPSFETAAFRPRILELLKNGGRAEWSLGREAMAGVTVGLIALPLALALGIASIPTGTDTPLPAPALGIYTAIIAGFLISLLGGSRVQIGGPTAAFIPIILLIVIEHGYSGLILATIMAGCILLLMGLCRMGSLIKFIPWPVTSGFTTGIAIAIMVTQIPDFLGIFAASPPPREFFEKGFWLVEHLSDISLSAVLLATGCVAIILSWQKLHIQWLPGSIVAMLIATAVVAALKGLGWMDLATIGSKFGAEAIPTGLPMPMLPQWNLEMVRALIGPAMAIAILGAIESLLSAVVADGLSDDHHDSNTELMAQGIANIICPFFGGLPATGAIARTSANVSNGAKTPLSGIIHALTLLAVVTLFAAWVVHIPIAAMSAVLIVVALRMGEWHELTRLGKMPASDALVLLTTMGLTVVFDLVIAIQVGMVLAAILYIKRVSETTEVSLVTADDVLESPQQMVQGKEIPQGVLVYRIFGPFFVWCGGKRWRTLWRASTNGPKY